MEKGSRLRSVAIDRHGLAGDEAGQHLWDDTLILGRHGRTIGVENTHDAHLDSIFAAPEAGQRLAEALAFLVGAARPDRIDPPDIGLRLREDVRIAVSLGGAGEQIFRLAPARDLQQVQRSGGRGHQHLLAQPLDVGNARWTGQVVDMAVTTALQPPADCRIGDIHLDEAEIWMARQLVDIRLATGGEIVDDIDLRALIEKATGKVGPQTPRASGDKASDFVAVHAHRATILVCKRRKPHPLIVRLAP